MTLGLLAGIGLAPGAQQNRSYGPWGGDTELPTYVLNAAGNGAHLSNATGLASGVGLLPFPIRSTAAVTRDKRR